MSKNKLGEEFFRKIESLSTFEDWRKVYWYFKMIQPTLSDDECRECFGRILQRAVACDNYLHIWFMAICNKIMLAGLNSYGSLKDETCLLPVYYGTSSSWKEVTLAELSALQVFLKAMYPDDNWSDILAVCPDTCFRSARQVMASSPKPVLL